MEKSSHWVLVVKRRYHLFLSSGLRRLRSEIFLELILFPIPILLPYFANFENALINLKLWFSPQLGANLDKKSFIGLIKVNKAKGMLIEVN